MTHLALPRIRVLIATGARGVDSDLSFLSHWRGPLDLVARMMLAAIFLNEGWSKIVNYSTVEDYMRANGVDAHLLPLVILVELGGGVLVLAGFKTRWAALALSTFCVLTALLFHFSADQTIDFQKNIAMSGGFLALAVHGAGPWSLDRWRAHARLRGNVNRTA